MDYDVIIVGSGFGGAVCAYRLAAAGQRVLVLERGRRWAPKPTDQATAFPRAVNDPWLWDDRKPAECHGWFDVRIFPNMSVVQGAGVGGGSLVYANVSVNARRDTFLGGWPHGIDYDELLDHYTAVGDMLSVGKVPAKQWPERTRLLKDAADAAGFHTKFTRLDLAVNFDLDYSYSLPDPHHEKHSTTKKNRFGIEQGTCTHLGNCDIGCDVNARNTLDLNYLAGAQQHHAEIRPLHIVRHVVPVADGYEVGFQEIVRGSDGTATLKPGTVRGTRVILAAGSLGSTELLLRSRDGGFLPNVSRRLGHNWSSNGDFLTPALHFFRKVLPTRGPTITAAIDLLGGEYAGKPMFIEDGGLPDIARAWLQRLAADETDDPQKERLIASLLPVLSGGAFMQHVMPWFAQARDAADGTLSLRSGRLFLEWDVTESEETMNAVAAIHRKLAFVTQGIPLTPVTWTVGKDLVTPHPLGGCNMGNTAADGVVDARGEVFKYPRLYVADGAIVPKAIGLNPSKTIAALAEHIAEKMVASL